MERDGFILAAGFFMLRRTAHVFVRAKTATNYTSLFSQHCDSVTNTKGGKGGTHTACRVLHVKEDSTRH